MVLKVPGPAALTRFVVSVYPDYLLFYLIFQNKTEFTFLISSTNILVFSYVKFVSLPLFSDFCFSPALVTFFNDMIKLV